MTYLPVRISRKRTFYQLFIYLSSFLFSLLQLLDGSITPSPLYRLGCLCFCERINPGNGHRANEEKDFTRRKRNK